LKETTTGRLTGAVAQQRGLADPRLSSHEHQAPRALGGPIGCPDQELKLVVALEQAHLGRDRNAGCARYRASRIKAG
jgi:hypothetical protein